MNASTFPVPTSRLVRAWRLVRVGLHLASGAATVLTVFPLVGASTRLALRQRWSRRMLAVLGIELRAHGAAIEPGCLLVANHISWLDIFVINALVPSAFVSKAEVRGWPLFGWLAAKNETVFLRRGSRGHAKIINAEIGALLDAGRNVAIFPEGTTTDGSQVLHFHAALLQPAIACGHAVQPVAISYRRPDGTFSRAPAYDGDVTLGQCLVAMLAEPRIVACTLAAEPLPSGPGSDRRSLAQAARAAVVIGIGREYAPIERPPRVEERSHDRVSGGSPVQP
ncbi:1-acyl-sn-glycerol-3-phosphate acyltransferase [Aromatoleum bremense]|uniref:1-acyl-sn-glycerol-3-phosphate acyltransferase n=2 Tax=Aromatoleum bremense TaxID=76115 RepID=A0ABX1NZR9_9RHOO|nr:1-acyl-sn-glycerol-3-phosphate acyltransferase [Aromatoleum bremense]